MPLPTLTVAISRSGWLLGVPGSSELGDTTYLGYSGTTSLGPVRRCTIDRGRSHELDRVEAGKARVRVPNNDGAFDPTNTASPFAPDVRPMIPVVIQATHTAVTYDLFNGFVEGWPQEWTRGPAGDAWVEFTAVDGFKSLNLARIDITRSVEGAGTRINAVLDAVGWPTALRTIEAGSSNVQAVALEATSPLQHIQDVAASEGGVFFIARDGKATFFSRFHAVLFDEQDTWGDAGTEKNYDEMTYTSEEANLWNQVTVTAPGLNAQTANDFASQALYGGPTESTMPRTLQVSTLLTTEAEMLTRAEELLARYATPEARVSGIAPEPRGEDTQWPRILPKDVHSRVRALKRPPYGGLIDQPSFVEGIHYEVVGSTHFGARWSLSSTSASTGQWQLGVVGKSELGVTTSLV